jgi:pyruvate dehydrogenase E2 component (dihydrolipoamide acetyltransferase)
MASELTMPKTGHIEEEATVYRWLKQEGEPVEVGEIILEVETQKAILEIEAFESGTLLKILVGEEETVPVGTPLALISRP